MRFAHFSICLILVSISNACGQSVAVFSDRIVAAWDPESDFQLFRSLGDQQTQSEIGLSDTAVSAYVAIRHRHSLESRQRKPSDRIAMQKRHRNEAIAMLEELLTPEQKERLKQLNYRIEIANIGLAKSVERGFLSKRVALNADQKSIVVEKAHEYEKDLAAAFFNARVAAEEQILAELAPDQRQRVESAIGAPWFYETQSDTQTEYRRLLRAELQAKVSRGNSSEAFASSVAVAFHPLGTDQVFAGLHPNIGAHMLEALEDQQVRDGLGLSNSQCEAVEELSETRRKTLLLAEFDQRVKDDLREILGEESLERLSQLMLRQSIAIAGIAHSLTRGRLSAIGNVYVQQRERLVRKVWDVQQGVESAIEEAIAAAEDRFLECLSPQQQESFRDALGTPWYYETKSQQQLAFDKQKRIQVDEMKR